MKTCPSLSDLRTTVRTLKLMKKIAEDSGDNASFTEALHMVENRFVDELDYRIVQLTNARSAAMAEYAELTKTAHPAFR